MDHGQDWADEGNDKSDESMPEISEVELRKVFGESPGSQLVVNSPTTMEHVLMVPNPRRAWLWCLHCERAYPLGSYRVVGDLQLCPYAECDGDTALDLWPWGAVRVENPQYPIRPELGVVYPLYSQK